MLLQTLAQLNILLMAAPALAGWVMSPVAHPMLVQAAQVAFQPAARQAEPSAPTPGERHAPPSHGAIATPPASASLNFAKATSRPVTPASAAPVITLRNPFPHATRAP